MSNRLFSEDNYGRFEALACMMSWMAVGAASAFLLLDVLQVLERGFSNARRTMVSAIAVAMLVWQLRAALSNLQDIREILRGPHSPVPTPLIAIVLLGSLLAGGVSIFVYRIYILQYFEQLTRAYGMLIVNGLAAVVILTVWTLFAGLVAWFVIYPKCLPAE